MENRNKEEIRQAVRESYGKVARSENDAYEIFQAASCGDCTNDSVETQKVSSCCGAIELTPEKLSEAMGYSKEDMTSAPENANLGLGCGNPVALASLKTGETVVDLGSGGGFDCFIASRQVGKTGKVIGVDMTPDMVSKARINAEKISASNVEFRLGEIEYLPIADNSADIVISNCVVNLSPDKLSVYRDAFRILKSRGRLAISDILATATLPKEIQKNLSLVSACIGGAATIDETTEMLKNVGFQEIKITPKDESREIISEWVPGTDSGDYVVSAYIEAVKP